MLSLDHPPRVTINLATLQILQEQIGSLSNNDGDGYKNVT